MNSGRSTLGILTYNDQVVASALLNRQSAYAAVIAFASAFEQRGAGLAGRKALAPLIAQVAQGLVSGLTTPAADSGSAW